MSDFTLDPRGIERPCVCACLGRPERCSSSSNPAAMSMPMPTPTAPPPAPTAETVGALLLALTTPSTDAVRAAERQLRALTAAPACIAPLVAVLCSPDAAVRHLSAVVLRRVLRKHWGALAPADVAAVKGSLLARLRDETETAPRRGVVALCAAVSRAERVLWPELNALAVALARGESVAGRVCAFRVFAALAEAVPAQIVPLVASIVNVLGAGLADPSTEVRAAALVAYEAAVSAASVYEGDSLAVLGALLPAVVSVAQNAEGTESDEFGRVACSVFDVFTLMSETSGGGVMRKYFTDSFLFALHVLGSPTTSGSARSAATEYAVFASQHKPKTLRKQRLALKATQAACNVALLGASAAGDPRIGGDDDDDGMDDEHGERWVSIQVALRLLDALARRAELNKLVFAEVISFVSRMLDGSLLPTPDDSGVSPRDGANALAFRLMGAIAQGCTAEVTSHAQDLITRLAAGAMDMSLAFATRARALEALGRVSEALDTDEMPDEVALEVANVALRAVLHGMRDTELFVRRHACMSLEAVVSLFSDEREALRERVPEVIQALGNLGVDAAVEAVLAVGVLAEHAAEAFASSELYKDVIEGTLQLMGRTEEKDSLARATALEAAGALVSACKDHSVVERLASHAIHAFNTDDPSIKQAAFTFFARMADAVGGSAVAAYGTQILAVAIQSMEREDAIFVRDKNEDDCIASGGGGEDHEEDDDSDADTGRGQLQVRTAFLEEKRMATGVTGAFASAAATPEYVAAVSSSSEAIATASTIRELFSKSISLIDGLATYFHEDVRAGANRAGARLAVANVFFAKAHPALAFAGPELLSLTFSRLIYTLCEDDDSWVVTAALNSTAVFCGELPPEMLNEHKPALLEAIDTLISGRAICQMTGEDDGEDENYDNGDDNDEVGGLIEGVGDLVEALARSLRGHFASDFSELLPKMLRNLYTPTSQPRNRGMVLGAVAGVLLFLNWDRCSAFQPPQANSPEHELALSTSDATAATMLPVALQAVTSADSKTLQRNAVFLVGIVFIKARETNKSVWAQLPAALQLFEEILLAGKPGDGALVDNAAGAVARIIMAPGLPPGAIGNMRGVLQVLLGAIPLDDDPSENVTVARALLAVAARDYETLSDVDFVEPMLTCLVAAVLDAADLERKSASANRQHQQDDQDPNDEMVRLDANEYNRLGYLLSQLRAKHGDAPFGNLELSDEDKAVLAGVIAPTR